MKKRRSSPLGVKFPNEIKDSSKSGLDNPDLGRLLLKQARDLVSSADNP